MLSTNARSRAVCSEPGKRQPLATGSPPMRVPLVVGPVTAAVVAERPPLQQEVTAAVPAGQVDTQACRARVVPANDTAEAFDWERSLDPASQPLRVKVPRKWSSVAF